MRARLTGPRARPSKATAELRTSAALLHASDLERQRQLTEKATPFAAHEQQAPAHPRDAAVLRLAS